MNGEDLGALLAEAEAGMAAGDIAHGLAQFDMARAGIAAAAGAKRLAAAMAAETKGLEAERDRFRTRIAGYDNPATNPSVLILADSLGLPKTENSVAQTPEQTYAGRLSQGAGRYRVTAICQRYMTTRSALELLRAESKLLDVDRVVVHLGINDRAARMFMVDERIGLSLLPADVSNRFLAFVRKHRRAILLHLPVRQYVDTAEFRANLDTLARLCARAGVKRVIFCTIIMAQRRYWMGIPGIDDSVNRHNVEISQSAHAAGIRLLDFDRLVWEAGPESMMLSDGIHLNRAGHALFAAQVPPLFR